MQDRNKFFANSAIEKLENWLLKKEGSIEELFSIELHEEYPRFIKKIQHRIHSFIKSKNLLTKNDYRNIELLVSATHKIFRAVSSARVQELYFLLARAIVKCNENITEIKQTISLKPLVERKIPTWLFFLWLPEPPRTLFKYREFIKSYKASIELLEFCIYRQQIMNRVKNDYPRVEHTLLTPLLNNIIASLTASLQNNCQPALFKENNKYMDILPYVFTRNITPHFIQECVRILNILSNVGLSGDKEFNEILEDALYSKSVSDIKKMIDYLLTNDRNLISILHPAREYVEYLINLYQIESNGDLLALLKYFQKNQNFTLPEEIAFKFARLLTNYCDTIEIFSRKLNWHLDKDSVLNFNRNLCLLALFLLKNVPEVKTKTLIPMLNQISLPSDQKSYDLDLMSSYLEKRNLQLAVNEGNLAKFKECNLNDVTQDNNLALKLAVKNGHSEIVRILLINGADIAVDNNYIIKTLLNIENWGMVKVIIIHTVTSGELNSFRSLMRTTEIRQFALEKVCKLNKPIFFKYLISNYSFENDSLKSFLKYAIIWEYLSIIEEFYNRYPDFFIEEELKEFIERQTLEDPQVNEFLLKICENKRISGTFDPFSPILIV